MGFYKAEKFDNSIEWDLTVANGSYINVIDTDFEHLQETEDKISTIGLLFNNNYGYDEAVLSKKYYNPVFFKFKDIYNKNILYDTLRITYMATFQNGPKGIDNPEDFIFSFGIKLNGKLLREWFIPIGNSCDYSYIDLDLEPLHAEYDSFNEVFITVLKHPGNAKVYLGSVYIVQDFDELHNIKLALADNLHLKYSKPLTFLNNNTNSGDTVVSVNGYSDIMKGTTMMIGSGDISEVHTVSAVVNLSEDVAELVMMNEFDTDTIQYAWPAGTPVNRVIPASIMEMRDSDAVFPLYFIYSEAFMNDESAMHTGIDYDSFVKDIEGNHKVASRKSWDSVTSNVTINVFSNTTEVALEMWRFLKSKVTTRDLLNVAGKNIQYIISGERDVSPDDADILPNYVMDLTFYFRHNVYNRKYVSYPRFSKIQLTYDIIPVEAIP